MFVCATNGFLMVSKVKFGFSLGRVQSFFSVGVGGGDGWLALSKGRFYLLFPRFPEERGIHVAIHTLNLVQINVVAL